MGAGFPRLSQKSEGDPNRGTIRVGKLFLTLTPTISHWERDRVRVHLWHGSRCSMSFETVSESLTHKSLTSPLVMLIPSVNELLFLGRKNIDLP